MWHFQTSPYVAGAGCSGLYNLIIPAAAHSNNQWQSDVDLLDRSHGHSRVDIALFKASQANLNPTVVNVLVPSERTARIVDILGSLLPASNAALGLRVCTGAVLANSRFYNVASKCGGTYGMWVPSMAESEAITRSNTGVFHHLSYSPVPTTGFRVNIGFANASAFNVTVVITLYGDDGALLGTITKMLRAYEHFQYTRIHQLVSAPAVTHGWATVTVLTAGGKLHAYAMLIDNVSLDPLYMPAKLE